MGMAMAGERGSSVTGFLALAPALPWQDPPPGCSFGACTGPKDGSSVIYPATLGA
ncbi:hypothetical protein ACW5WY_18055 [Aeromonas aquatica]